MNARALFAEILGTALLLATVVGSGAMGAALAPDMPAVALLANAAATAAVLYVLIVLLAPISGAHFNPVVTLASCLRGEIGARDAIAYGVVQFVAAIGGVVLAHAMFGLALLQAGTHARTGAAQWLSEAVATFGLVMTILVGAKRSPERVPVLVAAWIFAAYWFTASTSFANPAVTVARALTDTFAGTRPVDVLPFVVAQLVGASIALAAAPLLASPAAARDAGTAA